MADRNDLRIAVLIPCYNEAPTIVSVIGDFRAALPGAAIHAFDNNSTDGTALLAQEAGAQVGKVSLQGKGNVVRRMFADVQADVYVLVDGDGTYDARSAPRLVEFLLSEGLDMVVASRVSDRQEAYRSGHRIGNLALTWFAAQIFGRTFTDMLSGYRVFSRRYVKSFPAHSTGFEIETELAVHALELRLPVAEVETPYGARADGSLSKLNTYRDGLRILSTIHWLFRSEKPLAYYSFGFFLCIGTSIWLALPLVQVYLATGLVPRLPTAVLCAALILLGAILLTCGIVLDTVTQGRAEVKRLAYLSFPAPRQR